ncbi:MAG: DUF6379 domain-containing protein [Lachnospiraceae bacterium]|jgi:hypothetical protein|nr:DUF6379 domain-containing protein [Lachnospiraceae bacterium]
MFDQYMVRKDSLENVTEGGRTTGFRMGVRIADYRGCFLPLHNGYYLEVDGVFYPREQQKFAINGKAPRSFAEISKAVWEHWDFDAEGMLYVEKEGGLAPGEHVVRIQQSVLASYGYMPMQEEWVKNPPVPGGGAGSGKTHVVCEYHLMLKEEN